METKKRATGGEEKVTKNAPKKAAKKTPKKTTKKAATTAAKKPKKEATKKAPPETEAEAKENEKLGRQTPTKSVVLPYTETKGEEAVAIYEKTKRTAQPWQQLLAFDIMAVGEDGLWVHSQFGFSVPRRNGKSEAVVIRILWGLKNGEHILYTAHRTTTTHAIWERVYDMCEKSRMKIESSYKAFGKEHIEITKGGKIEFRTRTSKGALGEGFDLLVIDEAQEYQDDQETALKYIVSDSKNPQTILMGTPPTAVSSGTVFAKYRDDTLSGKKQFCGWAEWSVEEMTDQKNKSAWYETNPALGFQLTERKITVEIGPDAVDFNIQRLGLWMRQNLHSAIAETEWDALKVDSLPELASEIYVGVKFTTDSVAMAIAVKTAEGKTFVECIDRRDSRGGIEWIADFVIRAAPRKVIIDGQNGQALLAGRLKDAKVKTAYLPRVAEVIEANGMLEPMIEAGKICHAGQPALRQAATNCEHRAIGSNGGYGYKAIKAGVDIALLESAILAIWAADKFKKSAAKQKVIC